MMDWIDALPIEYKLMIAGFLGVVVGFVLGFFSGRMKDDG